MVSALINVVLNIILVPLMGIVGAAIATLVTFMVHLFVVSKLSSKRLSYGIDFKFIGKSIAASVPMAFVVWKLNPYGTVNILVSIAIAAAIYFGILTLLRGFTRDDYRFLRGIGRLS